MAPQAGTGIAQQKGFIPLSQSAFTFGLFVRASPPMPMNPTLSAQPRHAQVTAFSPRLQHAVRLLQMSSPHYALALGGAADPNPLLDIRATRRIAGVLVGGHWLDHAALEALRD